jgi:hemerythrin
MLWEGVQVNLEWSQELETGNETVDAQHKMLFSYVNDVIGVCENDDEADKIQETLAFLIHYTVQHFQDEEALQLECGYPEYEWYKWLHEDFKEKATALAQRFTQSGSSAELCNDVKEVVVSWLMNHIRGEDKKIGEYIRMTSTV